MSVVTKLQERFTGMTDRRRLVAEVDAARIELAEKGPEFASAMSAAEAGLAAAKASLH
jgi:hypothetical protein